MKKLKNILLWAILFFYLILVLGFVAENKSKLVCNGIDIEIANDDINHFCKKEDIKKVLEKYKLKMIGAPLDSVNTYLAENLINRNPAIQTTAAYTTIDGKLRILVEQRRPVLRVINKHLQQYFVDENAQIIPLRSQYSAFTLLANGNIDEPFSVTTSRNIYPTRKDTILMPNIIYDLYRVAKFIDNDNFWQSQIEQIYVNSHLELVLIPRVGSQIIVFGKGEDIDYKFKKLKAIYRTFNQIGWNQYKTINLKYSDQVICIKR